HYLVTIHPTEMQIAIWSAVFNFGLHRNKKCGFPVNKTRWPSGRLSESDTMKQETSLLSALSQ
ncbi:hypothetical protein K443DRAFT_104331, partial [Laccaria amethystina LaAM-08-1]